MDPLNNFALVFLMSAGGCLAIGRVAIRALAQAQWVAPTRYEDCPPLLAYHETKAATPTMGGVFVLAVAIVVASIKGGLIHADGWLVVIATLALAAIGLTDDWLKFRRTNAGGLPGWPKLLMALGIGGWLGLSTLTRPDISEGMILPWSHHRVILGWWWVPLSMVVIAGCAHAVNLTDGMDGLAAGCVAMAFAALGMWIALCQPDHAVLGLWCASLAGACVGFLWFNSFPASVYLGDVGALGLGAALGTIGLLTKSALVLLVIGGVFVVEALSVMLQVASYKWRNKQRVFRVAPIHHHFHLGGMPEPKLIVRFWIVGLLLALIGITALVCSWR